MKKIKNLYYPMDIITKIIYEVFFILILMILVFYLEDDPLEYRNYFEYLVLKKIGPITFLLFLFLFPFANSIVLDFKNERIKFRSKKKKYEMHIGDVDYFEYNESNYIRIHFLNGEAYDVNAPITSEQEKKNMLVPYEKSIRVFVDKANESLKEYKNRIM